MKEIYQVDLLVTGKQILIAYVVFVGIYAVITYIIYAYRYTKAKKSLKKYSSGFEVAETGFEPATPRV